MSLFKNLFREKKEEVILIKIKSVKRLDVYPRADGKLIVSFVAEVNVPLLPNAIYTSNSMMFLAKDASTIVMDNAVLDKFIFPVTLKFYIR